MVVPIGIPCLGGYKIRNNLNCFTGVLSGSLVLLAWLLSKDEVFICVLIKLIFFSLEL